MTDLIKIRGYVEYIFYPKTGMDKNKHLQFAGFVIKKDNGKKVKCFGMVPLLKIADYFELTGNFENENQFKVSYMLRVDDNEIGATSMLIFIFGPKTAQKVIKHYANDALFALDIFKNHESKFCNEVMKISSIGKKTIDKAYLKYEKHIAVDILFNRFAKYGLILNKALKVYSLWGDKAISKIEENPYNLTKIDGITFSIADAIGVDFYHLSKTDVRRVEAAALFIMRNIGMQGHVFIKIERNNRTNDTSLVSEMEKMLALDESVIKESIIELIDSKKLIKDKLAFTNIVYLPEMFIAEQNVANKITSLLGKTGISDEFIEKSVREFEETHSLKFADKQIEAIKTTLQNKFSMISGPPGSGKTTIIDAICDTFLKNNPYAKIQLAAPTGRAAKKISESTGKKAETIHRMLRYNPIEEQFEYNEGNPLDLDILIVDEFSMCSLTLTNALIKAIPKKAIVLIVGDKNQLPSVQEGKVLEDLLGVNSIAKTILDKIYRQKAGSTLLKKGLEVAKGIIPSLENSSDFNFYESANIEKTQNLLIELYFKKLEIYPIEDIMLLTPQNKGLLGVDELNGIIQKLYNPPESRKKELKNGKRIFREGDRVLQLKNEEEFDVYNGMIGTITDITYGDDSLGIKEEITVDFNEGKPFSYTRDRFDNLNLAYATTIHKAQGSEALCVIMVVDESHKFMLRKKILYTGMTRAKEELNFIGQKDMIKKAIMNLEPERNTKLRTWFKKVY